MEKKKSKKQVITADTACAGDVSKLADVTKESQMSIIAVYGDALDKIGFEIARKANRSAEKRLYKKINIYEDMADKNDAKFRKERFELREKLKRLRENQQQVWREYATREDHEVGTTATGVLFRRAKQLERSGILDKEREEEEQKELELAMNAARQLVGNKTQCDRKTLDTRFSISSEINDGHVNEGELDFIGQVDPSTNDMHPDGVYTRNNQEVKQSLDEKYESYKSAIFSDDVQYSAATDTKDKKLLNVSSEFLRNRQHSAFGLRNEVDTNRPRNFILRRSKSCTSSAMSSMELDSINKEHNPESLNKCDKSLSIFQTEDAVIEDSLQELHLYEEGKLPTNFKESSTRYTDTETLFPPLLNHLDLSKTKEITKVSSLSSSPQFPHCSPLNATTESAIQSSHGQYLLSSVDTAYNGSRSPSPDIDRAEDASLRPLKENNKRFREKFVLENKLFSLRNRKTEKRFIVPDKGEMLLILEEQKKELQKRIDKFLAQDQQIKKKKVPTATLR